MRLLSSLLLALTLSAATIAGNWTGQMTVVGKTRTLELHLATEGSKLTGSAGMGTDMVSILDGKAEGSVISFSIPSGAQDVPRLDFQGAIEGNTLKLTVSGKIIKTGDVVTMGEGSLQRAN